MRYFWAPILAGSAALHAVPATARDRDRPQNVSTAPGNLSDALSSLAIQTGISLGYAVPIPARKVKAVRGRMAPERALDRLLRGTGIRAVRIGPTTFRIVLDARAPVARPAPRSSPDPDRPAPDIVITGRKLPELLSRTAAPIAVYVPSDGGLPGAVTGEADAGRAIDGLLVAGRGAGADRAFIRGLADSPFNGFSQGTVSVQLDEGRITYDAPEPGLRLVDVARVEVLKGPQGPLYGTGALGGVYRVVTNRPVLGEYQGSATFSVSDVGAGGLGGSAEATVNAPLLPDLAALRVTAYSSLEGGWIDQGAFGGRSNQTRVMGGRASLRVVPADDWTVDVTIAGQRLDARSGGYVYRIAEDLARDGPPEPRYTAFRLAQARVAGTLGGVEIVAATSQSWQDQEDRYDLSSSQNALQLPGASMWRDRRAYRVFDQELRLSSLPGSRLSWTAGASYLSASTRATGQVEFADGARLPYFALHRGVAETAVFADGTYPVLPRLNVSAGFRLFRSSTDDERQEPSTPGSAARTLTGFTPNLSASYDLGETGIVYLRLASAFRPGGLDPGNAQTGRYRADEVRSLDIGTKIRSAGGRVALDASLYVVRWSDVQSDYLEPDGLLATRNAGDANVTGVELTATYRPDSRLEFSAGVTAQRARLTRAVGGADLPKDRRLPLAPDLAFRLSGARSFDLGGVTLKPSFAINVVGATRLSFDDGLDRRMPAYVDARAGAIVDLKDLVVRLDVANILGLRADTYAYGNPFTVRAWPQYTPLRPRTVTVAVTHDF